MKDKNNTDKLIEEAIDFLVFANYKANRARNPEIAPARWGKVYGETLVIAMENKLQKQLTAKK